MEKFKKKPKIKNRSVKKLREIIHRTQREFAAMVGCSKETVVSVENEDRNNLTPKLARKIYMATGADVKSLLRGDGKLMNADGKVYTEQDFLKWRTVFTSTEEEAIQRFQSVIGWIGVVFLAAAKPGSGKKKDRLPALYVEITDWLKDTVDDFQLKPEITAIMKAKTKKKEGWCQVWNPGGQSPSLKELGITL